MADSKIREIYFAGGCFWGIERLMQIIPGVEATEVGYANSTVAYPSYVDVCTGHTGAAETVRVLYDPEQIDLVTLIDMFFGVIDPTRADGQGNDIGTQYRTGIYYTNPADINVIQGYIDSVSHLYEAPVVVEVLPLHNFYRAEEYHQNYLEKHPHGYCHIDPEKFKLACSLNPKKYKRQRKSKLMKTLSLTQYEVTQNNATETPFVNPYYNVDSPGIYVDITTGEPLFTSRDKFMSPCGWPSFTQPISDDRVTMLEDRRQGQNRVEVRSSLGNAHLGHVFADGPEDRGGLRYSINSAALRFIPLEYMATLGYAEYTPLVV